jgi:selenocysteine lyase/cysteine desulfurase
MPATLTVMVDEVQADAQKLAALRAAIPAVSAGIYLDAAAAGPLPAETAAALREADEWELRVGRGGLDREAELEQREAEAKAVISALIPDSDPDDIVLTGGPIDAVVRIARASNGYPGVGAIVVKGCIPGAHLAVFGAREGPVREVNLDDVTREMARATAFLLVPIVDFVTGEAIDLDRIIDVAGQNLGALVLDASAAAGAMPLAPKAMDLAANVILPGDRWLLGPEGSGAIGSTWGQGHVHLRSVGERPPRRSLLGLARSVGWLEMYVGLPWIYERTVPLAALLAHGLAETDGVDLLTPLERMAAIVTFRVRRWRAEQVAEELSHRIGAILSIVDAPAGATAVRASVGWWNTEEEIDRFTEAIRLLAAHTPDSLPRRPALTVLQG